jgi:cell division protease FtsH
MSPRSPKPNAPRSRRRILIVMVVLASAFSVVGSLVAPSGSHSTRGSYTRLLSDIGARRVRSAELDTENRTLRVTLTDATTYSTGVPGSAEPQLLDRLTQAGVSDVVVHGAPQRSALLGLLGFLLPPLLIIALFVWMSRRARAGVGGITGIGRAKARRADTPAAAARVTFADVAGADEAVEELQEIKEFLADPRRFRAIGARIPKGVLLYGPPGTGKTLLARAVAGEAGVPFLSISGSDFVEMFVGVGASRVRDLFEQARKSAPCIVFVDEIDAVGRHRGAGHGGGNDEREQTLNQLLVEMDGFTATDGVILIAATNRPDVLDPALLRPGRFDRQITVGLPDRVGRRQILAVHARGKPLAAQIDLDTLGAQTPGFSGADLSNVINEAALLAARRRTSAIEQSDLDEAVLRAITGPERKTRVMSEKERRITAYHEMGHAIVGHYLPNTDPIHKISVITRGQALGYTISLPTEDRFLTTRAELLDTMAMTLGGRAAEEIVFGEITTGAANDIEKVTATAKKMVMRFGMSDRLGPRAFGHDRGQPFLGRVFSTEPDYSEEIAREIDDEIRRIVDVTHQRARDILTEHRESLERLAETLINRETIEQAQFESLLQGKSEAEAFGPDETPQPPAVAPNPQPRRKPRPRGLPRPGLAGSTILSSAAPPRRTGPPERRATGGSAGS